MEQETNGVEALQDTIEGGAVTPATMLDFPVLFGISGQEYRAVNLLTEMTTRHKNYLRECIAPVYPLVMALMELGLEKIQTGADVDLDQQEVMGLLRKVNLSDAFNAVVREGLEIKLLAALYLPKDNRTFDPDTVDQRMDDLDLTWDTMVQGFKNFFTWNMVFSRKATLGFFYSLMRSARRKVAATS